MRERAGSPVLDLGPVQGWGKVPAADASNTLHTACLWSEFSGCGQCGGGRKRTSYKNGWRKSEKASLLHATSRGGERGESLE